MKSKLIFILWLLMFSFFSCNFGIKENEETNSKEYFTVKGSCSIQGAIPSDLLPKKSIKQNAQRTVVPEKIDPEKITVIFKSETGDTKSVEVVNNDGVLNFEVELPAGKWTVKAQGKKSNVVIIESESYQIELSAENKSANVTLVLKPTQSDTEKGFFKFSFGQNSTKVSGMKYTYEKHGDTEPQSVTIDNFSEKKIELSSGVYTFRFDFYSDMECTDELLYSFTEVVNIFDGLTTDTWIGAGEYINEGVICITDNLISQFVSTTVYVSTAGDDTNLGTFFAPVNTIQKAVNKVIAMNVITDSSKENPYKIFLLSDIISDDSFESNNNALVNIDPSSVSDIPLYLTISKYGVGNATINANRTDSKTGRVMYIGENANVTLKNLTLTGGYLKNDENKNGGGIYSKGNCNLNSCTISGNTAKASSGSVKGGGVYIESGSFTMEGCTISGNTAGSETSDATANAYGGGIYGASGTNITMNDTTISDNKVASVNDVEGAGVCLHGANLTMNGGLISKNECSSDSSSFGGGVYVSDGTFSMEGDAVVDSSNDVYLKTGKTITISGELTFNGYVATITPENYEETVKVLDASDGITLSEQVGKFNVTKYNNNNNVETTITDTGFLKNTLKGTAILTKELYDICSTINVSSADGMKALSQLEGETFAGKTIILEKDVVLDENYEPIHTFSGVFDGDGHPIKINAPTSYAWDSPKGKALFYIVKGENAEIKDLIVSGTAEGAGIAHTLTEKAKISNCKSYVNITTNGDGYPTPGGIVSNLNNGSIIENCENYGKIICNGENNGGGIVGSMAYSSISGEKNYDEHPVIANCTNYGEVTIEEVTYVVKMGGICGDFGFGTIFNCANKGKVTVTATETTYSVILGGIVGFCWGKKIDGIINCYNSGEIHSNISDSTKQNIGGIVGSKDDYSGAEQVPKFVNTVNNYAQILSFGKLEQYDTENTTNNYYKISDTPSSYLSYESSEDYDIGDVKNTLNDYSDNSGRKYLTWKVDNGNIVFEEENSDNQGITP